MKNACIRVFLVEPSSVFIKTRKKMKGEDQYEKQSDKSFTIIVKEQGQKFLVNLTDYLDTGLFFDHRPLRNMVRSMCQGKKVLNLFCYTGAFSVYAAQGKASKVDSVDLSKTYLTWAQNNMKLNGFLPENNAYSFIQNDTVTFLNSTQNTYDIIILDPPTFSNSKRTSTTLDINRDYPVLINACLSLLSPDGTLFFSTNSKKLFFEPALLNNAGTITDITELTIPEDFRNKKIHRCWKINN
jgi:23S rRNA (cytosine1962-C5)-methyltransferase